MAFDHRQKSLPTSNHANTANFYSNHKTLNNAPNTPRHLQHAAHNQNFQAPPSYYHYPDRSYGPRFGLIRGYHKYLYDPRPQQEPCCECPPSRARKTQSPDGCNWGVAFGCILLIIGVLAILMGFLVPQKPSIARNTHLTSEERHELSQINLFIDVFVITGLAVLSMGGLLISVALLLPLLRRRTEPFHDEPIKYFGSEVYVKSEQLPMSKSGMPTINLGFHKDIVPGNVALRKIQPESVKSEPVDLITQANSP